MRKSLILKKLREGKVVIIPQVGQIANFKVVEMIGLIGFDGVWLDMEHKDFGYEALSQMTLACRATGMDSLVRIVKEGYTSFIRPLETGATGLMIPHCMSAEEAAKIVQWAKFRPEGLRGIDGAGVDGDYLMVEPSRYVKEANKETFLVAQIEDREAVDCIDGIASVKGIDILFIGPGDLSQSYGVFPQFNHKLIYNAIDKVAKSADRYNKWWGMPVSSPEHAQELINKGARFMSHGADVLVLVDGFRKIKSQFSNIIG